jgi:hypothetical protein
MQESQKQTIEEEREELPILSNAAIRDELSSQLGSKAIYEITNDGHIIIDHKYYDQAEYVLYRVSIWKPLPVFVINCSDLKEQLQNELEQLKDCDPRLFDKTVTQAVQSLIESVNQRYYHVSGAAFKVLWRFED